MLTSEQAVDAFSTGWRVAAGADHDCCLTEKLSPGGSLAWVEHQTLGTEFDVRADGTYLGRVHAELAAGMGCAAASRETQLQVIE